MLEVKKLEDEYWVYDNDGNSLGCFPDAATADWFAASYPAADALTEAKLVEEIADFLIRKYDVIDSVDADAQVALVHTINARNFRIRVEEF